MENLFILLICMLIGFAISAAVTAGMLSELKSVAKKDSAVYYIEPESFNLTYSNETFLKTDTNKIAKDVDRTNGGAGGPGGGQGVNVYGGQNAYGRPGGAPTVGGRPTGGPSMHGGHPGGHGMRR